MEDSRGSSQAAHGYKVDNSKRYCQSEVKYLLQQLRSWREESNRQFSNIIDSQTSNINKGINDLADEVGDLKTKLAVITQERNNLVRNVKKLSGENRNLKATIHIVQPTPDLEENEKQGNQGGDCPEDVNHSNKELTVDSPGNCRENGDHEQDFPNVEGADPTVVQQNKNPLNDQNKLNDTILNDYHEIEIKDEAFDEEVTNEDDVGPKGSLIPMPGDDHNCPECGFMFSTEGNLRIHFNNVHSNFKPMEDQSRREALEIKTSRGVKLQNKSKEDERLKCYHCHYETFRKAHLEEHIKAVHEKIKDHKCEECDYASVRKSHLIRHRNNIHKKGEKMFKCKQCPYADYGKSQLKRHIKGVHDNIRDHKCEDCEYASSQKSALKRHRKTVHNITYT